MVPGIFVQLNSELVLPPPCVRNITRYGLITYITAHFQKVSHHMGIDLYNKSVYMVSLYILKWRTTYELHWEINVARKRVGTYFRE